MPNDRDRLPPEKIEAMWQVYRETGSVQTVVSRCKVNWRTADRYRIKAQWDERRDTVLREAAENADREYAEWLASQQKVIDAAIAQVAKTVIPLPPAVKPTFSDLVNLIRLGNHLRGGVDQRVEQDIKTDVQEGSNEKGRYKKVSEVFRREEIRQALERLQRREGARKPRASATRSKRTGPKKGPRVPKP